MRKHIPFAALWLFLFGVGVCFAAPTLFNLATQVQGILAVANGGTGAGSFTSHGLLFGNGTSAFGVSATGTAGQLLLSGGSGANGLYNDFPDSKSIPFAICVNGTAGTGTDTTTAVGATCRAGTNNKSAFIGPFTTSDSVAFKVHLPKDWDTGTAPSIDVDLASTDATNAHTIILQVASQCFKLDGSTTDDVAFNTAQSMSTVTLNGNANRSWNATLTSITTTGCSAPGIMIVKVTRTTDTATNVELYQGNVTIPRMLVNQAN